MIYPGNFEKKIGFDEIRSALAAKCLSGLGKELVQHMSFSSNAVHIVKLLTQVKEFRSILNTDTDFPDDHFYDMRPTLFRIRPEGTYVDEGELFDLKRSLHTIWLINRFFYADNEHDDESYPALQELIKDIMVFPDLIKRIDQIITPYGKIQDHASLELARIRSERSMMVKGISVSLRAIIQNAQKDGYVEKDITPTLRDGRLVIPVAPAMKRRIKGIIHDESATGKTVFIEPAEVVEANNRIRELEGEEKREIIRILKEITSLIRPNIQQILSSFRFLAQIDFIRAKALYAESIHACDVVPKNQPLVDWVEAVHPLLQQSLSRHGKKVVPLDITLNDKQRILIISGPNAGGKSVCLKTVGLLQYMLQCGLPIPLKENSHTGIFESIFIDIGDEQSIEDDLSTYSSHLLNMKVMMKQSGPDSLLLIDEFGGGTEPQIGGAMAEAILKRFVERSVYGVITTHYQNLKHYADSHSGVANGAMLYDRHQMRPLFQLQIGNPGSSFAVEIARKIGIPEEVIADASTIVGADYIQSDKYLQDIVRDKRYWENKRQQVHQREKQLEQIVARYESDIRDIQAQKKEILNKAKEEALNLLNESNARIENTIRGIREAQAEKERTQKNRQELEAFKNELVHLNTESKDDLIARRMEQIKQRKARKEKRKQEKQQLQSLPNKIPDRSDAMSVLSFSPGDLVRIKGQESVGKILTINNKKGTLLFGTIKTTVALNRIELAQTKPQPVSVSSLSKSTYESIYDKKLQFKPDIDVRGMRGTEALSAVTYFIDDAILLGMSRVRILHGTGTGALRSLIRDYLRTLSSVKSVYDEHVQFGGSGITVVDFT